MEGQKGLLPSNKLSNVIMTERVHLFSQIRVISHQGNVLEGR